jgi:hypothetical protein
MAIALTEIAPRAELIKQPDVKRPGIRAGGMIAIPLPNIGSMGGEYGRSEGATAENAVPFPGAARRLLDLLSTDGGDAATRLDDDALAKTRLRLPGGATP